MTEQHVKVPGASHGQELAMQAPIERALFEVSDQELIGVVPRITEGKEIFSELVIAMNPKRQGEDDNNASTSPQEEAPQSEYNRSTIRKAKGAYANHLARIIRTGARFIATFDDHEEGVSAGREVFTTEWDEILGDAYSERIAPAAQPLRRLYQASQSAGAEVATLLDDEHGGGYVLLKGLGGRDAEKEDDNRQKPTADNAPAAAVLAALIALGSSADIQKKLTDDVHAGVFDHHIAYDVLQFADQSERVEGDLTKVRQLVVFLRTFLGNNQPDGPELYEKMARMLDAWPTAQRQVVLEARQTLTSRLATRLGRASRYIKENDFVKLDDPKEAFESSFDRLADEALRRTPVNFTNKAEIMALRAQQKRKRPKQPKQRPKKQTAEKETTVTSEVRRDPLKLVTCNLNDYSIEEGTAGLIDEFIETASQGNTTLRADVERILHFMARTDLPPDHRRGVKPIGGAKVKFGTEDDPDKLWNFFELKPTDAAGLSTRTTIAKNLRVYFIKMGDDTLGIIGIKSRSEQDEFLRRVRVKTKRRD